MKNFFLNFDFQDLRLLCFAITLLLGWSHVKRRIKAPNYLSGNWEGKITCNDHRNYNLDLKMSFTSTSSGMNEAMVYYSKFNGASIILDGVNVLVVSKCKGGWFPPWLIEAEFSQLCQSSQGSIKRHEQIYTAVFEISFWDLFMCNKCDLVIKIDEDYTYAGTIYRR